MTWERCLWCLAGPSLGILIVGLRATVNKPLGALGGYIDLASQRFASALSCYSDRSRRRGFCARQSDILTLSAVPGL